MVRARVRYHRSEVRVLFIHRRYSSTTQDSIKTFFGLPRHGGWLWLSLRHRPNVITQPKITGIEGATAVARHLRGRGRSRELRRAESQDRGDSGGGAALTTGVFLLHPVRCGGGGVGMRMEMVVF